MRNGGCGQSINSSFLPLRPPHAVSLLRHGVPPWDAFIHKLLQRGTFSRCSVLQEQTAPAWVPPLGCSSCQEPGPGWALHQLQLLSECVHLLWYGGFHGLQVSICSTVVIHGLQEDNLLHHGLLHRLQGNLRSSTWSTSSPPSPPTLVSALLLFPCFSCSSLSQLLCSVFLPFIKCYHRGSTSATDGLSFGQQ